MLQTVCVSCGTLLWWWCRGWGQGAGKLSWKNRSEQGTGGLCVAVSDMRMGNGIWVGGESLEI